MYFFCVVPDAQFFLNVLGVGVEILACWEEEWRHSCGRVTLQHHQHVTALKFRDNSFVVPVAAMGFVGRFGDGRRRGLFDEPAGGSSGRGFLVVVFGDGRRSSGHVYDVTMWEGWFATLIVFVI